MKESFQQSEKNDDAVNIFNALPMYTDVLCKLPMYPLPHTAVLIN